MQGVQCAAQRRCPAAEPGEGGQIMITSDAQATSSCRVCPRSASPVAVVMSVAAWTKAWINGFSAVVRHKHPPATPAGV
jgi:hypothetical protein